MKNLTLILICTLYLQASDVKQLLIIPLKTLEQTHAKLYTYEVTDKGREEVFQPIDVIIGRNGSSAEKVEGDGKSPLGSFALTSLFGYEVQTPNTQMPYIHATKNLHCVDDSNSSFYNKIIEKRSGYQSYEVMRREDALYKWGIVVDYNHEAQKAKGSCIFVHIMHPQQKPTAGCTAMREEDILKIITWLDEKKEPTLTLLLQE
ncbi:MAG: L,D-transpeptidase family protein [Epsilonproteobacteria bacterium]|nr:L,D-transpeptidase family protein [Campylobacterota bacterium]OIO17325.1 MAG: hypothetical protein AUJ81_02290 [Helicobacteraceae bacterium CG1_02_36_14]PIP10463.1 MAG: hypothetical protein COX50_05610 [Sulfurimonas sp. CG23_combo_of_CG06-09_8_20_14_all_36_33]PIS26092.1 MAG: hypothetical protein COT46_03915 [Sulfurimonas sp. CG08_land_8_20_14_0_20_36_33]PIU35979.1 MAG: hypothetical protein COT05_01105 [Sulfurimonas sp. CG07_land_8_20_14_0_80_36_56]PIV02781.1 MAG: hypothetical protein COS56_